MDNVINNNNTNAKSSAKSFNLKAKRGLTFEDKRIEIDNKYLKYYNPSK